MKKRNVLQIALAAGIVATGVFAGGKDGEAGMWSSNGSKYSEEYIQKFKQIPKGSPKTVGQLRERMKKIWPTVKKNKGYESDAKKVVVVTTGGGTFTIELDSSYNTGRDNDILDGKPKSFSFLLQDGTDTSKK